MKGVLGDIPTGEGWIYELKWDGIRAILHISDGQIQIQSSTGRDITATFPELAGIAELGDGFDDLILDGEIVAFDGAKPSFNAIQQRLGVTDPTDAARRAALNPTVFVAFDLLGLDGHDTRGLALTDRRQLLEQSFEPGPHWRLCDQHHGDLDELLEFVTQAGLEGVMIKRAASPYRTGRRSGDWVKVKPRQRQEFVVGGWLGGRGRRAGQIGSLLLGVWAEDGVLEFAGGAGSGLDEAALADWQAVLDPTSECPFSPRPVISLDGRPLYWCRPDQVAEVAFHEWPTDGQLRHPVVVSRRHDTDPGTIWREPR